MAEEDRIDLRPHGLRLTEQIRSLVDSENFDPKDVGSFLRSIKTGLEATILEVSRDPSIDYEEKGRLAQVIALVYDSIEAAYRPTRPRPSEAMPALRRR